MNAVWFGIDANAKRWREVWSHYLTCRITRPSEILGALYG